MTIEASLSINIDHCWLNSRWVLTAIDIGFNGLSFGCTCVANVIFNLREPERIIRIQDHSCPVLLEIQTPLSSDLNKQPMQVSLLNQALKNAMSIEHWDRFMAIHMICRH